MSDWSSDVCSSDPSWAQTRRADKTGLISWKSNKYSVPMAWQRANVGVAEHSNDLTITDLETGDTIAIHELCAEKGRTVKNTHHYRDHAQRRSEEHTSELQSLMRISYAVFCLKKKQNINYNKPQ